MSRFRISDSVWSRIDWPQEPIYEFVARMLYGDDWEPSSKLETTTMTFDEFLAESAKIIEESQRRKE